MALRHRRPAGDPLVEELRLLDDRTQARSASPATVAAYTPSAIDRVSRRADGWMPAGLAIEAFALMFAAISGLAAG